MYHQKYKNMKHLFAPYDIAVLAKENGFDENCICTYNNEKLSRNPSHKMDSTPITDEPYEWNNSNVHNTIVCAPLYQQLIDWFLTKHKILIRLESNGVQYEIIYLNPHYENGFLIGNNGAILNNITYNGLKNIDLALIEAFDLIKKIG